MKILHTSDWHIGRMVYGRKRYDEFAAFLTWLAEAIEQDSIDVLLVAGDVFDTTAPSNRAQALYYRFLCRVAALACRHVVVIAGNHDSPSFLDAPKELLKTLDIHVVGSCSEDLGNEVIVLCNDQSEPELIVCAVPYLRDRDVRLTAAGETVEEKERKLLDGIQNHYATVAALAERKREEMGVYIPIIGMGHLFTAGGQTIDGDGVRELYVGSLVHVPAGIFPSCFDYVALGHLHVSQTVNGIDTIRYSGSPLPMGFGEATQKKCVIRITFDSRAPDQRVSVQGAPDRNSPDQSESSGTSVFVERIDVPMFQKLERITGDWDGIAHRIAALSEMRSSPGSLTGSPVDSPTGPSLWLEIIYDGAEIIGDLRERLEAVVAGTSMEILRIKNNRIIERVLGKMCDQETLDDLSVSDVFERCLTAHAVPEDLRPELLRTYRETLASLADDDVQAE